MVVLTLVSSFIMGLLIGLFSTEPKYEEKTLETQLTASVVLGLMSTCFAAIILIVFSAYLHLLKGA